MGDPHQSPMGEVVDIIEYHLLVQQAHAFHPGYSLLEVEKHCSWPSEETLLPNLIQKGTLPSYQS
jgi:hypothetical protein